MRSVVEQSYPNIEYIIMDGGSTDGTVQIIQRYASHLAHWCAERDEGQYDAIQKGFAHSSGEILGWLNADDMFLPRSLWIASEVFRQFPDVEWISTLKPGCWDANGYFTGTSNTPGFSREAFLDGLYLPGSKSRGYWIQQESTFWRRSLWEKVGARIPIQYSLAADFALWAAFYQYADLYGIVYPIAGFRILDGQRSEATANYIKEAKASLVNLRGHFSWKESPLDKVRFGNISKIPRLKPFLTQRLGYVGHRIVNRNERRPRSGWKIEKYQFLP